MNSQKSRLLSFLKAHKSITTYGAIRELGILLCSERIRELIADGYKIDRLRVSVANRYGEHCRVARYVYQGKA